MNNKLKQYLTENKSFMSVRLGATEAKAILYPNFPKFFKLITKKIIFKRMFVWSGFFPINEIVSGASIAFAALLLIVPGFFTDLIGFILLVPFTRNILLKFIIKKKSSNLNKNTNKTIEGEIVNKDKDEL